MCSFLFCPNVARSKHKHFHPVPWNYLPWQITWQIESFSWATNHPLSKLQVIIFSSLSLLAFQSCFSTWSRVIAFNKSGQPKILTVHHSARTKECKAKCLMCTSVYRNTQRDLPVSVFYTTISPACFSTSFSFSIPGFCGCNSPLISLALCEDVILWSPAK